MLDIRCADLPASIGQHEDTEGDGCPRHGVRGRHAVFGVVEDLHLHHGRGSRPGPADHILGGLSHEQVPGPDHDQPPADQRVHVPEKEGEEDDEEHLVTELSPEREQVEQKLVVDQELLAHVPSQGVSSEGFCPGGVRPERAAGVTLEPVSLEPSRIPAFPVPDANTRTAAGFPHLEPLFQPVRVRRATG